MSPLAIGQARRKAAERGPRVRFEVADALNLRQLGWTFDTVIDSALFHVFDDAQRHPPALSATSGSRCLTDGTWRKVMVSAGRSAAFPR